MSWYRMDNLYDLDCFYDFEYIREEAELHRDKEELEVLNLVQEIFYKDFPELFEDIAYQEAVIVEYCPFEVDSLDEYDMMMFNENNRPGYAIYIYFSAKFINLNFPDLLELDI